MPKTDLVAHGGHLADATLSYSFGDGCDVDEPNLVSAAGLVPVLRLAQDADLGRLACELLTVPSDKGANAGGKVTALVAGMAAGADSIDDMTVRYGPVVAPGRGRQPDTDASAKALSVHRSTLKYRLNRIRQVSGYKLSLPDNRFNLQLAIRALRTLQAMRRS